MLCITFWLLGGILTTPRPRAFSPCLCTIPCTFNALLPSLSFEHVFAMTNTDTHEPANAQVEVALLD
jgi:hypothetical protein